MENGLYAVSPNHLDAFWKEVAVLLAPAVEWAADETSIDALQLQVRNGDQTLLVWLEDDVVIGAATLAFQNLPRCRVAFIAFMGGKPGFATRERFSVFSDWCRSNGASVVDVYCRPAAARLFRRFGLKQRFIVSRCEL